MAKIGYSIEELVAKVKDTVAKLWLIWLVCREPLGYNTNQCVVMDEMFSTVHAPLGS